MTWAQKIRWKGADPHHCRFSHTCSLFLQSPGRAQAPSFSGLSGPSEWSRGAGQQRGGFGKAQGPSWPAVIIGTPDPDNKEDSVDFALCLIHIWFQIGKGVCQGCILSLCLFNLYAEYIMRNAGLEEEQAGIKIARRNINKLRYADDTTLMAESEEELKSLLMEVKEESEKVGLKLNIEKTKIMASGPITSWQIDGETVETVADYFFGLQNHCRW